MRATISNKEEVAKLTDYAEFELQGERPAFQPGQYFFVTLKPEDELHKDDLTHLFSIVNSPNQPSVLALTTRMRLKESLFKRTLNQANVGDQVEIGEIGGKFVLPDNTDQPIVLIALGIGITPYISMLRWAFEEAKPFDLTLIYCDGETESMPFLDELQQMDKSHDNFKLVICVTHDENWPGEKRHVDGDLLADYLDDIKRPLYYVSGPPKAVEAVAGNLKKAGIAEENIKTDSFSGY